MSFWTILIQSTLCFGVASLALIAFRRSPHARIFICRIAMVTLLASALATPWLTSPFRSVAPALPAVSESPMGDVSTITPSVAETALIAESMANAANPAPAEVPAAHSFQLDWAAVLVGLYVVGLGFGLLSLTIGYCCLAFMLRRSRPVEESDLLALVHACSARIGVRTPRVRWSDLISSPFVTGIARSTLLLPVDMDHSGLSAIIPHELCHLKHRDLAWLLASRLMRVVLWVQPLTWVLDRAHRNAAEERCDAAVLDSGVAPESYAGLLVQLKSARLTKTSMPVVGIASKGSNFAHRIREILEPRWQAFSTRSRIVSLLALGIVGCLSSLLLAQPKAKSHLTIEAFDEAGRPVMLKWAQGNLCASLKSRVDIKNFAVSGNHFDIDQGLLGRDTIVLYCQSVDGRVDVAYVLPDKPTTKFIFHRTGTVRGKVALPIPNDGTFRIRLSHIIRGRRDSEGYSVAWIGSPEFALSQSVPIDRAGNFEMSGIPLGSDIGLDIDDDRLSKPTIASVLRLEMNGYSKPANLTFGWAGSIEGYLTDDGKPVGGAFVGAQGMHGSLWGMGVTDAQGRYRIPRLFPGTYIVAVDESSVRAPVRARQNLIVKAKESLKNVNLETEPGGVIEGQIVKTDGTPDANISIGVYGPAHPRSGSWVAATTSDAHGNFRMRVPAGEQYVYNTQTAADGKTVQVAEKGTVKVTLQTASDLFGDSPFEFLFSDSHAMATDIPETRFLGSDQPTHAVLGGFVDIRTASPIIWHPDGSKVPMTPDVNQAVQDWLKKFKRFDSKTFALVRMTALPCDRDRFIYENGHVRGSGFYHGTSRSATFVVPISNGEQRAKSDLRIGIPAELPKTVFKGKASQLMRPMRIGNETTSHYRLNLGPSVKDKDWDLKIEREGGRTFHAVGYDNLDTIVLGLKPNDTIGRVTVTARKVGWATFKGVALGPRSR